MPSSKTRASQAASGGLPLPQADSKAYATGPAECAQVRAYEAIEQRLSDLETTVASSRRGSVKDVAGTTTATSAAAGASGAWSTGDTATPVSDTATVNSSRRASATSSTLPHVIRDMYLGCLSGCVEQTPDLTMGRVIHSMMQGNDMRMDAAVSGASAETAKYGSVGGGMGPGRGKNGGPEDGSHRDADAGTPATHLSPKSANTPAGMGGGAAAGIELGDVPKDIADKQFRGYILHISTRWPVLHSSYLRRLHHGRSSLTDIFEKTVLHMVYAIGGRFLETAGERGMYCSDQHCEQATRNLDTIVTQRCGLQSVQVVLLFAIYNLRSPKGLGAWTYTGLAMRQCIEMGLHRSAVATGSAKDMLLLEAQMRKRIFWTCYCLDRQVSMILGRPFAISDRDIDVELPLDVEESVADNDILCQAEVSLAKRPSNAAPEKSTSMTAFIHFCRLRRIESDIQQTIYRVDKKRTYAALQHDVDAFMERLVKWKAIMPLDAKMLPNFDMLLVDGYHNYMIYFYKCISFLLYPIILSPDLADSRYLKECAEACGGLCRTYKTIHQAVPVGFSIMALHSIFMAGLTMLYCTWAAPREVFTISVSRDIQACSIVLYIVAERWVGARKYRDVFEIVKEAVLESIEQGGDEPRCMIANLRPGTREALTSVVGGFVEANADFSVMLEDMMGSPAGGSSFVVGGGDSKPAGGPGERAAGQDPSTTSHVWIPDTSGHGMGYSSHDGDGVQRSIHRTHSMQASHAAAAPSRLLYGTVSSSNAGSGLSRGGTGDNTVDFMFPLDNLGLDAMPMDYGMQESMGALMDGLVDIPHGEWTMDDGRDRR